MPPPRRTLALLAATLALAAGAFGLGRALRDEEPSGVASVAASAWFTKLGKAATPRAVPLLGHAAPLPKPLVRRVTSKKTTNTGTSTSSRLDETTSTSGAGVSSSSTGITSHSTPTPEATTRKPSSSTKKTDSTDNSVSSGGNSLGG